MSENISLDPKKIVNQSIKTFKNLLKEFPKNATDDFFYDDNTLQKIRDADKTLTEMVTFFNQQSSSLAEAERDTVKDALNKLSLLMEELPKDSADEFLYDRIFHNQVEDAREIILKLSRLFS